MYTYKKLQWHSTCRPQRVNGQALCVRQEVSNIVGPHKRQADNGLLERVAQLWSSSPKNRESPPTMVPVGQQAVCTLLIPS